MNEVGPAPPGSSQVDVLGVAIADIGMTAALDQIVALGRAPGAHLVATVNPEFIMLARRDPEFRNLLARCDLRVADGAGVVWQARRRGAHAGERVTGVDLVRRLAPRLAAEGLSLFLLGAAPGVAETVAAKLVAEAPGLQIAGTHSGSPAPAEAPAITSLIAASGAAVLLVAYGTPAQEFWLDRHLAATGARVGIGVGGSFDFLAGTRRRAPVWMQARGLEWLYRLAREPRRAGRMLALPQFVVACLADRPR